MIKYGAMPRQNKSSNLDDKPQEQIEISFLSFKFKCSSPTSKTIIILVITLIFLLALAVLLPRVTMKWLTG
jgi:hypothetical protein